MKKNNTPSIESEYLETMDDCDSYRGKWIAILDTKIIADGVVLAKVYDKATKIARGRTPLFHRIPEADKEENWIF